MWHRNQNVAARQKMYAVVISLSPRVFLLFLATVRGGQWFGPAASLEQNICQTHQRTPATGEYHMTVERSDNKELKNNRKETQLHLIFEFFSFSLRLQLRSQTWSEWRPGETPSIPPRGITWSANASHSASLMLQPSGGSSPSLGRLPTSSLLNSSTRRCT